MRACVASLIATVNGHPVTTPAEANLKLAGSGGSTDCKGTSPLLCAAPAVLLSAALALAGRSARRRESPTGPADDS